MVQQTDQIVTVRRDQVTAEVDAEFAESLAERLDDLAWPELEVFKSSRVREVSRGTIELAGQRIDVHLKAFRPVTLSDRARDALGGSRGIRELRRLRDARAREIPSVRPLAAGRLLGSTGTRSFLLTETFDGAPMPRRDWSADAAATAGALLRIAHDHGLHAPDLHPENLLLAASGDARLCDLTSAVIANPLEDEQRARALGFFCLGLDGLVQDPLAAPLLASYGASPRLIAEAQRMARRLRNRALSAFGRRATRPCRHTEVVQESTRPRRIWYRHRLVPAALHAAAQAFDPGAIEPVRRGRRGAVWLAPPLVAKQRAPAAATRLFRAAYWLQFAGVPTPRPVALDATATRGIVFTEHLAAPDLATELPELSTTTRRSAAAAIGDAVGRLHAFGLRNRDLKLENLVRDPDSGEVLMTDLDGVRRRAAIETRGRGRDVGRLLASYRQHVEGPVDVRLLAAFRRSYDRAFECLATQNHRSLRRHIEARADEWAATHPRVKPPKPGGDGHSAASAGAS